MKPFVIKPSIKPNAIEKLFNIVPKKNFLIDVNNLLATKTLDNLSNQQIREFAVKYKIKNPVKEYKREFLDLIKEFLTENLGNYDSDVNDFKSAKLLQTILEVSENDFDQEYAILSDKIFTNHINDTLSKTLKCENDEDKEFEQLRQKLEIPENNANIAIDNVRKDIVQKFMDSMIADARVSPDEMEVFEKLCKDLHVSVSMDSESRQALEKYSKLWLIDNGILPVQEVNIILQKSEYCHYKSEADLFENRRVTTGVRYGGNTFRVKIAKGWYYRVGDISASQKTKDVMTQIDSGVLYITNKRILFAGLKNNKVIRYNQIIDLNPYKDGIEIVKDSGKSPTFIIKRSDSDVLTATIARIIRESQI